MRPCPRHQETAEAASTLGTPLGSAGHLPSRSKASKPPLSLSSSTVLQDTMGAGGSLDRVHVVKGEGSFRNVPAVQEALVLRGQGGQERGLCGCVEGCVPREACMWLGARPGGQGSPGACRGPVSGDEGDSEGLGSAGPGGPICHARLTSLPGRRVLSTIYTRRGLPGVTGPE